MASASHLMKKMNLSTGKHGVTGVLLDGAVGFGASYALGQIYHRKNDKWYGKNAPRIAAIAGKLGAIGLAMYSGSPGLAVGVVNSVGQAGINAIGLEMGLRHARKSTGKKAVLVPADADVKKIAGASEMTSIGALPKAPAGRSLSWDQIEELATGR
jgi:hypothetical protein